MYPFVKTYVRPAVTGSSVAFSEAIQGRSLLFSQEHLPMRSPRTEEGYAGGVMSRKLKSPPLRLISIEQPDASVLDSDEEQASRPIEADDLLTVEEAAEILRIGRTSLYELLKEGELRSLTIGRKRFLTRAEVARFKAVRARHSLRPGAR